MPAPSISVQLVILSQGYCFAMFEAPGVRLATGQGPAASLAAFVSRLAADAAFTGVKYSGPLASPPAKFSADLPAEVAAELASAWRDLPPDAPG